MMDISGPNIYQRINAVQAAISNVEKAGVNAFHKYNYVMEADIMRVVKPLLKEHGLSLTHSVTDEKREGTLTTVKVEFALVNEDQPNEWVKTTTFGYGMDNGDKGVYKAITGATKYFLLKQFLIPAGDDPEKDSPEAKKEAKVSPKPFRRPMPRKLHPLATDGDYNPGSDVEQLT